MAGKKGGKMKTGPHKKKPGGNLQDKVLPEKAIPEAIPGIGGQDTADDFIAGIHALLAKHGLPSGEHSFELVLEKNVIIEDGNQCGQHCNYCKEYYKSIFNPATGKTDLHHGFECRD